MSTALAEDRRALGERLEEAYFALARTSRRWFERRMEHALLGGFSGLDAPSMNRAARLSLADDDEALTRLIVEGNEFFGEREVAWCIEVTPFDRPEGLALTLRNRGHPLLADLTVMTRAANAPPLALRGAEDIAIERAEPDDLGEFTQVTIDAFRMPERYLAGLMEVNAAWAATGAAYLARKAGRVVGTALLTNVAGVAGIYNVSTLKEWRRHGVGRALMARALDDASRLDTDLVTLQVARGSVAERMYERMGFTRAYTWELYAR